MTTDPRLAPLAAALHLRRHNHSGLPIEADTTCGPTKHDLHEAAAILAALPPGWCGHYSSNALIREQSTEIARLRDDLAHCERAWEDAGNEIARPHAIEAEAVAAERERIAERVDAALFDLEVGRAHPGIRAEYRRVVMAVILEANPRIIEGDTP